MTDKPAEGNGKDEPEDKLGEDFSELTPEQFLDKTAGNKATEPAASTPGDASDDKPDDPVAALKALVAERTGDLQRLQAEYVNYKRRVDRDRDLAHNRGVESVVRDLLPVFDAINQASAHGELTGGFKLVADELRRLATKHGLVLYGKPGEEFDPHKHEALMQVPVPGDGEMLVHEVMQKGVELNGMVVRPARVVVSMPNGEPAADAENGDKRPGNQDQPDHPAPAEQSAPAEEPAPAEQSDKGDQPEPQQDEGTAGPADKSF